MIDEGLLHRMQLPVLSNTLYGDNLRAVGRHRQGDTRGNHLTVEQHSARSANAYATAFFGAGEAQVVTQTVDQ